MLSVPKCRGSAGKEHPEWYSYINGEHRPGRASQWCLTNPEVFEAACEKIDSIFKANPGMNMMSVSQNDGNNTYCQCPECMKVIEREGAVSGLYVEFLNKLAARFPDIPLEAVCGNCDFDRETEEKVILVENKRIFLCHGHRYHVKSGYLNLQYAAREKEADLVLFGHTHRIFYEQHNGLSMLNPGSIGEPRYPGKPSYGRVIIENGQIFLHTFFL